MAAKNITVSVRFSREQLGFMIEALMMHGLPTRNLSEMVRMAIGKFTEFTDAGLVHRGPSVGAYGILDTITGHQQVSTEAKPHPFGLPSGGAYIGGARGASLEVEEPTAQDIERAALVKFIGMGKILNDFKGDRLDTAKHLWKHMQTSGLSINSYLNDEVNPEAELICAEFLSSSGILTLEPLQKYKTRCLEIIEGHYKEESD